MLLVLPGNKLKCHAIYANLCEIGRASKVGLPRLLLLGLCSVSAPIRSDSAKHSATKPLQAVQRRGKEGEKFVFGDGTRTIFNRGDKSEKTT